MEWTEIQQIDPIYLNLGGAEYCHPRDHYEGYVSVDACPPQSEWAVQHDLTKPIPLADESVARIHTEDFLEHIARAQIQALLSECYRLLAPGARMRIGVPDYNNPKDRQCLCSGSDPRYPGHVTLTHYGLMQAIVEESPFTKYRFYHYWDRDEFVSDDIDYTLGWIRRTPDNDSKWRRNGALHRTKTAVRDLFFRASRGFRVSDAEFCTRKGHRLNVTSLVVDLFRG